VLAGVSFIRKRRAIEAAAFAPSVSWNLVNAAGVTAHGEVRQVAEDSSAVGAHELARQGIPPRADAGPYRAAERRAWAQGFVDGANASALGLIVSVTTQISRGALVDPLTVLIAVGALGIIWRWPLASPGVVIAAAAAGMVRFAIS
jgi:hypothetical protein